MGVPECPTAAKAVAPTKAVVNARRCQRGRAAPSSLDEDRFLTSKTGSSMGTALYAWGRVIFAASFFPAGAFGIRILTLEGAAARRLLS